MKIRIDGREISARPEDTILQAARREGIWIPSLCYQDATEPTHSCRLCMVEVEEGGRSRMVAACAYKVKEGLTVVTETEDLARTRRTMLKLLYTEAPDNPVLLDLMKRYGVDPDSRLPVKEGQCILCGLCVEACKKLGSAAISTVSRGVTKTVNTPYSGAAMSCIGCASCAGFCPTHCITVEDTEDGRTIWNKKFQWARCEICGAILGTQEHYMVANGSDRMLCPDCRQKAMGDVFAWALGERG